MLYLEFAHPSWLNERLNVINLPNWNDRLSNFVGVNATASGFGMISDEPGSGTSVYLRYVNMTVISTFSCQIFWSQFVNDNNICTNTLNGTSTCAGDNGGPLVATTDDERLIIVGVGSFRSGGGCTQGHPGLNNYH